MELSIKEHVKRVIVIAPRGRLDAYRAQELQQRLDQLIADNVIHFVIDLTHTNFLDSAGMAVLVGLLKRVRRLDGNAKLVWPMEEGAQRVLNLTRFDRVFEIVPSAQAGVDSF